MFSFQHDKVGFFSGLTLMIICIGSFIATVVLLIIGWANGDWQLYGWPIKWVIFGWWIGCIVTVLTRVYILSWQMKKREREAEAQSASTSEPEHSGKHP